MDAILFSLLCLIWGASFLLMKKASLAFGPVSIAGLRCALGGLALLGVWASLGRLARLRASRWRWIAAVTVLGYAVPYALQPYLVARHGSGFIGMMIAFVPLLTILVSVPALGVLPTRRQLLGVLGGLAAMALVMLDGLHRRVPVGHLGLALLVPLSYSLANVIIKRHLGRVSPVMLSLLCMGLVSLVLVPGGLGTEPVRLSSSFGIAAASVAVLGLLGTGLATVMFYRLIQRRGPLFAGMVTYVVPLGAVGWGWLDAERVTLLQLLGLGAVLSLVVMVQRDVVRQQGQQEQQE